MGMKALASRSQGIRRAWFSLAAVLFLAALVPLLAMLQLRAGGQTSILAGDVYLRITIGVPPRYLGGDQPFSIPMLWLADLLVGMLGACMLFSPQMSGDQLVRLLASGSRSTYWGRRALVVLALPAGLLAWRAVLCSAFAFVTGGSPSVLEVSDAVLQDLRSVAAPHWDAGVLFAVAAAEVAVRALLYLSVGLLTRFTGAPVACAALLGYVAASLYASMPVGLPCALMVLRLLAWGADPLSAVGMVLGALPFIPLIFVLFSRLEKKDVL